MAEIRAYLEAQSGLYQLYGKTYHRRGKLKEHGARWNPEGKYWLASRSAAEMVGADFMMRVRVAAHCHESEREIIVTEREAQKGTVRLGCGMCDTSYLCGDDVDILEVLGPAIIEGVEYV